MEVNQLTLEALLDPAFESRYEEFEGEYNEYTEFESNIAQLDMNYDAFQIALESSVIVNAINEVEAGCIAAEDAKDVFKKIGKAIVTAFKALCAFVASVVGFAISLVAAPFVFIAGSLMFGSLKAGAALAGGIIVGAITAPWIKFILIDKLMPEVMKAAEDCANGTGILGEIGKQLQREYDNIMEGAADEDKSEEENFLNKFNKIKQEIEKVHVEIDDKITEAYAMHDDTKANLDKFDDMKNRFESTDITTEAASGSQAKKKKEDVKVELDAEYYKKALKIANDINAGKGKAKATEKELKQLKDTFAKLQGKLEKNNGEFQVSANVQKELISAVQLYQQKLKEVIKAQTLVSRLQMMALKFIKQLADIFTNWKKEANKQVDANQRNANYDAGKSA